HRTGNVVSVPLPDGRARAIRIAEPKPTGERIAALQHEEGGDVVWVSDTVVDEHVPRALGAILGEAVAKARGPASAGASVGELDAMFAHRERVAETPRAVLPPNATRDQVRAHAQQASKEESTARIDAEIDLALFRMGVSEPGPATESQLAKMPSALAAKI